MYVFTKNVHVHTNTKTDFYVIIYLFLNALTALLMVHTGMSHSASSWSSFREVSIMYQALIFTARLTGLVPWHEKTINYHFSCCEETLQIKFFKAIFTLKGKKNFCPKNLSYLVLSPSSYNFQCWGDK